MRKESCLLFYILIILIFVLVLPSLLFPESAYPKEIFQIKGNRGGWSGNSDKRGNQTLINYSYSYTKEDYGLTLEVREYLERVADKADVDFHLAKSINRAGMVVGEYFFYITAEEI